jgi:hypothetical protein
MLYFKDQAQCIYTTVCQAMCEAVVQCSISTRNRIIKVIRRRDRGFGEGGVGGGGCEVIIFVKA